MSWDILNATKKLFTDTNTSWDKFKNGETNQINQQIANQNLDYQRQNLQYQKELQNKIFEREDNSYQRTVADMRAAGLSPLTMSGTDGAGEVINTEPLHNDYQHQDKGDMEVVSGILNTLFGSLNAKQDYDIGKEVQRSASAKATQDEVDAQYSKLSLANRLANLDYDTRRNFYKLADDASVYDYNNTFGFNSAMSSNEKAIYSVGKALNLFKDDEAHGGKTGTVTDPKLGFKSTNYRSFKSPMQILDNISDFAQSLINEKNGNGKKDGKAFNNALKNAQSFNPFSFMDSLDSLPPATRKYMEQKAKEYMKYR